MPIKAVQRRTKDGRSTRLVYLNADEAHWAMLAARFEGESIAAILSPIIRKRLWAILKSHGVDDPDATWKKFEAANGE